MAKEYLTAMQLKFAQEFVAGNCAKEAARRAGYTEASAQIESGKLLKHPLIQKQIQSLSKQAQDKLGVTFNWRVEKLKTIIDSIVGDGHVIKPKQTQVAISAISEMTKMLGDYAPDKRLRITVDATANRLIEAKQAYDEF